MTKVKACSVCSGSSANAIYIEIDNEAVLIDAGCNAKYLTEFLQSVGSSYDRIKAVFVTHEHSDHIKGIPSLAKRNIPVISNRATLNGIKMQRPETDGSSFREMPTGFVAKNGKFSVSSFKTSHDSAESVGYIVETDRGNIGVITDLGTFDEKTVAAVEKCRLVFIEANHDEDMLWQGVYPYPLKKRIAGNAGHLSNFQCGKLLSSCGKCPEFAVLSHLSRENNTPERALKTVSEYVSEKISLSVAPRSEKSDFIIL